MSMVAERGAALATVKRFFSWSNLWYNSSWPYKHTLYDSQAQPAHWKGKEAAAAVALPEPIDDLLVWLAASEGTMTTSLVETTPRRTIIILILTTAINVDSQILQKMRWHQKRIEGETQAMLHTMSNHKRPFFHCVDDGDCPWSIYFDFSAITCNLQSCGDPSVSTEANIEPLKPNRWIQYCSKPFVKSAGEQRRTGFAFRAYISIRQNITKYSPWVQLDADGAFAWCKFNLKWIHILFSIFALTQANLNSKARGCESPEYVNGWVFEKRQELCRSPPELEGQEERVLFAVKLFTRVLNSIKIVK